MWYREPNTRFFISSRPVVYLPNKEFSVAVRFSPVKYELRPVPRVGVTPDEESKGLHPWERYQVMREALIL